MGTSVTSPKGVQQPVNQNDTEVKPTATPPPPQRTEADPHATAKAKEGSKQHATDNKTQNDMRSQMLKNQLASEVSDPSFRNLGEQFAKSGKTDPRSAATAVQHTWNNLPISSHGPIAYETAKNLTDKDLQTLAKTKEGREFLQKIENGMMDGNIEPAHQAQIDRIRKAHLSEALPSKDLSNALLKQATAKGPVDGPWIAKELTQEITKDIKNGARTANDVLDKALPADRERIAAELTKSLSSEQLQELAKTPEGRKLIDRMSAEKIPYAELKKLASVPDSEKDPLKRSEKAMAMAERMARAAGPKDQDDAIAMLARTRKQLTADGHSDVFQRHLNSPSFQHLLEPFGLRRMEGGSQSLKHDHLKNFDAAVSNWEKMKPAEREAARNPRTPRGTMKPLPHHEPTKAEIDEKARMDRTQTIKTLPDGKTYQGPLGGLKDAEEAANIRMAKAKYDFAIAGGPAQLLPGGGRAAGKGGGGKVVTIHQPAKYTPKSQAKSGQQSNVGTAPTQPAQPKVQTQPEPGKNAPKSEAKSAKTKNAPAQGGSISKSENQVLRKQQEGVVDQAIGKLSDRELNVLRERLIAEGVLRPGINSKGKVDTEQAARIRRHNQGINNPGDREHIVRETREALDKTRDPITVDFLQTRTVRIGQRETTIADELQRLRDARVEEHVENPGAKVPQEQDYPKK